MDRAKVSINDPKSSDKRKSFRTNQAVVSDRRLVAECSSASGLIGGLTPSISNGIEVLPAHGGDQGAKFLKRVKVAVEVANHDVIKLGVVQRFSDAGLQDGRGEIRLFSIMSASTVTIDVEGRKYLTMASHAITEMDDPTAVSKLSKGRHDRFKLKQRVARSRNGCNSCTARIVMIGRARHQSPLAIMLEAVLHRLDLKVRDAVLLYER